RLRPACGRAVGRTAGDAVLVLGAGVQGLVVTAALARRGCAVTACDPHPERRALARAFGALRALDAPRDPAGRAAVAAALPGGADVVVAAHAGADTIAQALDLVARGGEVNVHGGPEAEVRPPLPAARLHYDEITVQASYHHTPHTVRAALWLIAEGGLPFARLLGEEIALEGVAAALARPGPKRPVRPA
ncbi:MAG TPA: zinc-binding dehydrogenase, partial [Miltoncostaeaceae bacterium]|nr:zinc-binding dehydrogenase [Miltoncostaeaceae bacterium]